MTQPRAMTRAAGRRPDWPTIAFFFLAYATAWGAFGIAALIARDSGIGSAQELMAMAETLQFGEASLGVPGWLVYLLSRLADFAFSIAGVVMIAATAGRDGLRELWGRLTRLRIGGFWYVAGLLPIILFAFAAALAGGFASADFSSGAIRTALFSAQAGFFVSLFLRGAMGEELGLRGFALPRLQERMTPFRASLVIGVLWFAWHLPVLVGRDAFTVAIYAVLVIGLGMIFTWIFNGSGGSLIPPLLFHAAQNWEEGFETVFPSLAGTEWELPSTLALLLLGIAAGLGLWKKSRNRSENE